MFGERYVVFGVSDEATRVRIQRDPFELPARIVLRDYDVVCGEGLSWEGDKWGIVYWPGTLLIKAKMVLATGTSTGQNAIIIGCTSKCNRCPNA